MKKYLKYLSFCFLAGVGLTSCEADDNGYKPDPVDAGAYAYLQDQSITLLDRNADITINLFTEGGVSFESVAIEDEDGNQIATANVAGETATFSSSDLGNFMFEDEDGELTEITGSYPFVIVSELSNGLTLRDPAEVSVGHAISVGDLDAVVFMDPTSEEDDEDVASILEYSVSTHAATVDDFILEYRVGEEGAYQEVENVELSEDGSIDFSELHYLDYGVEQGDVLYYRFTATSGDAMDQVETAIEFLPQAFSNTGSAAFTNEAAGSQFNFASGLNFGEASEDGEVLFTGDGIEAVNDAQIQFVDVTGEGISIGDGAYTAKEAFEAGTPVSAVSNLSNGDVLVYKATRQVESEEGALTEEVVYGIIEVGSESVVDGDSISVDFDYGEGAVREPGEEDENPEEPGEGDPEDETPGEEDPEV